MPIRKVDLEKLKALLPEKDNVSLAELFGVSRERIRQLRRTLGGDTGPSPAAKRYAAVTKNPEFQELLGHVTDGEVARKFGVPVNVVYHARTGAGIASYAETRRAKAAEMLEKHSDVEIAARFGYTPHGVAALRARKAPKKAAKPAGATDMAPPNDTMEFLLRRHRAGDSTEALAARLEMPEATVKSLLNLA